MTALATSTTAPLDSAFAACLDALESGDTQQRREALAHLQKINDQRALAVAHGLIEDHDPTIRDGARTLLKRLTRRGLRLRRRPAAEMPIKPDPLFNTWDAFDEAVFIVRNNLTAVYTAAVRSGLLKLCGAFVLLLMPDFLETSGRSLDPDMAVLGPLVLLFHQIFFRPAIWLNVGRACLGGCRDREAVILARAPWPWSRILSMYLFSLVRLIALALPSAFFIFSLTSWSAGLGSYLISGGFFLLCAWIVFPFLPICLLLPDRSASEFGSTVFTFTSEARRILWRFTPMFLLIMGLLYAILGGNIWLITERILGDRALVSIFFAAMLADLALDPLWIAFHLLITRLMLRASRREAQRQAVDAARAAANDDDTGKPRGAAR